MSEKTCVSPADGLNSEQQKAVATVDGALLIMAGAGAGKTKTIAERIRRLVETGVAPSKILAITFTNKAAREMKERIENALRESGAINTPISNFERPFISTFHSLGVHILREQAGLVDINRDFSVFDKEDSKRVIREVLQSLGLDPKTHEPAKILSIISREKGSGRGLESYDARERGYLGRVAEQVWPGYEKALRRDGALDFDDLLLKTRNILRSNPDVRNYYSDAWPYIHIDEYQDTNRVQYEISKLLAGKHKNICVVGDVDQNIYSWRGAEIKNILDFEKDYPNAAVILLEENYRSTKTILEAANAVIEKNKIRRDKNLFTDNGPGEKIGLFSGLDETREAEFVAAKAEELIKEGAAAGEIAVLYRANFQSRALEEAFMNRSLPYELVGTRFFERKEVKDVVAYLRAALNPENVSDFKRIINVPSRGLGKTSVLKIMMRNEESLVPTTKTKLKTFRNLLKQIAEAAKERRPSEVISFIIKTSGLEQDWKDGGDEGLSRLENAYELVNFAARFNGEPVGIGILNFLADAALQSDQDEMGNAKDAVRLMTVHASKGLEFDIVFVTGLETGLFPARLNSRSGGPHGRVKNDEITPEEAEEERRLFYVALTRARKKLFLTYAETRNLFGSKQVGLPSEFLSDIPENLVEEEIIDDYLHSRRPLLEIEF